MICPVVRRAKGDDIRGVVAAMPQVDVHGCSNGTHQPASFFGVGSRTFASEPGESRMRLDPLTFCGQCASASDRPHAGEVNTPISMPSGGPVLPAVPGRTRASSSIVRNEELRDRVRRYKAKIREGSTLESCEPETRSRKKAIRMRSSHGIRRTPPPGRGRLVTQGRRPWVSVHSRAREQSSTQTSCRAHRLSSRCGHPVTVWVPLDDRRFPAKSREDHGRRRRGRRGGVMVRARATLSPITSNGSDSLWDKWR
jgi:hypothetical protein